MLRLCNIQLVPETLVVHVILAPQGLHIFHLCIINAVKSEVLTYAKISANGESWSVQNTPTGMTITSLSTVHT